MFTILRNAALSALIGFGVLASLSAPAAAQSGGVYLGFGNQGPSVGFHFNDRGRHDYRGQQARERERARQRGQTRGYCSAREAVRKATRMGLRNARVVASNHRIIRVEGRRAGQRYYSVAFINADNCPVLR